jgi:molybdopterin molybdotransferase
MVFALPGNPFSCLVNFEVLIRPFLHSCFGLPSPPVMELPLLDFKKKHTPLDEFFPVRLAGGAQGQTSGLVQVPINSSGDIRLALHADGLALHPADRKDLSEGTTISYYIF